HAGTPELARRAIARHRSVVRDRDGEGARRTVPQRRRAGARARSRDRRRARSEAAPPWRCTEPQAPVGGRMTTRASISAMTNAADALRAEEIKRTRALLGTGWISGLVVAAAVLVSPGDHRLAQALLALLAVGVLGSLAMHRELRDVT